MLTSIYPRKGRKGVTLEYTDPVSGRLRQRQFRAKDGETALARAKTAEGAIREAFRQPQLAQVDDITFATYADRWLRATKTAVREGTYRNYEMAVRVHLAPVFQGKLRDVTRSGVRDLVVALRESGLKKKSVRNIRATLHAIFEAAIEEGLVSVVNPAHSRSKSKLMRLATTAGEARAGVKAMDVDQARAFLAAVDEAAPAHAMLFRTMLATGLRPGEAIALKPGDLDYRKGRIRLARAITRGRVEPCKTNAAGEFEHVDMPRRLAAELKSWETRCAAAALETGHPRSEWLFPGTTGGPRPKMTQGHLDDTKRLGAAFARVLTKAGLPDHFTPHCLRHTYATQQLAEGESVYYVQRQLRHADITMTTRTYGSWLPAGNRAAADRHYDRLLNVRPPVRNDGAKGALRSRRGAPKAP